MNYDKRGLRIKVKDVTLLEDEKYNGIEKPRLSKIELEPFNKREIIYLNDLYNQNGEIHPYITFTLEEFLKHLDNFIGEEIRIYKNKKDYSTLLIVKHLMDVFEKQNNNLKDLIEKVEEQPEFAEAHKNSHLKKKEEKKKEDKKDYVPLDEVL